MMKTNGNSNGKDLRRHFPSRHDLVRYLAEQFPDAAARDSHVSETRGGRVAAEKALAGAEPGRYAWTRNYLSGKVTKLSPYIRHGVLSLAEVRDAAFKKVKEKLHAAKFVAELAWRDYFQRLYRDLGNRIWEDQEPYKTGLHASEYAASLPPDIREGSTGLICIDSFSRDLRETGYLHNHARMWLASYVVHWRRVRWQAGAAWFLEHLLDGDPASNNLSWQWVASTFSSKPYVFNRENLERYSEGYYCRRCPYYRRCDFEGSYEQIGQRLFQIETTEAVRNG